MKFLITLKTVVTTEFCEVNIARQKTVHEELFSQANCTGTATTVMQ